MFFRVKRGRRTTCQSRLKKDLLPPTHPPQLPYLFPKSPACGKPPTDISSTTQAAIGSVTGSEAWKASGEQAKAHGVSDMKAASEGRDASSQGYGKAEELAGKAVGCEGMVKEGDASGKKE